MDVARINWLAVPVAAALMFVIGGVWYSGLFARRWRQLSATPEGGNPAVTFGLAFVAALVVALNLAFFLAAPSVDVSFGALAGLAAGLGWVAMAMGITYLFERRALQLWLIDAGYHVVAFTAMGALLGAWR
jgi:hypothetical protein